MHRCNTNVIRHGVVESTEINKDARRNCEEILFTKWLYEINNQLPIISKTVSKKIYATESGDFL